MDRRRWAVGLLVANTLPAGAADVPAAAKQYQRTLTAAARFVWGLDAPIATFAGQVAQESAWNAQARSRVGALGLAQFMPATADWIDDVYAAELGPNQPLNPSWALRALVRYDRHLFERIAADGECEQMAMALSAYNGGQGWLERDQRACAIAPGCNPFRWFGNVEKVNAGRAPVYWSENRGYPRSILFRGQYVYKPWGREVACSG